MASSVLFLYVCLVMILLTSVPNADGTISQCHCGQVEDCYRIMADMPWDKEVYMVTNGSSKFKEWDWETVTTVLATEDNTDPQLMCYAHYQQRKYGFIVDLPVSSNYSTSRNDIQQWVTSLINRVVSSYADMVVVNLMPALVHPDADFVTADLVELMTTVKKGVPDKILADCIVPWKPSYKTGESQSLTSQLSEACNRYIINPDSYTYIEGYSCKARATVPMSKLILGVDEYISEGIDENRLILGIPWHGYDYPCKSYNVNTSVCELDLIGNTSKCDIENRRKLTVPDFPQDPRFHLIWANAWNHVYQAPYHTYYENETDTYHQMWMEDIESLRLKYVFASDLLLKGIAVWTGDDLTYAKIDYYEKLDDQMFSWILHQMLHKGEVKPRGYKPYYYANTVTAAALGCLFGGLLLGIIFTCIGFKRIHAKKRLPPFKRDTDEFRDEFHDEDMNL